MKLKSGGFTLIEAMLVSTLVALLGTAIFHTLSNGLRLWSKGLSLNDQSKVLIGLEKLGEDVRGVFAFSLIDFKGSSMKVSFPTVVITEADRNSSRFDEGRIDSLGAVEYRFEPSEGKIYRRQADYGQALKKVWGPDQEIAANLSEVDFHYYFKEGKSADIKTSTHSGVPRGVEITLKIKGQNDELKKYFSIPAGGA